MEKEEFNNYFDKYLKEINVEMNLDQKEQFYQYLKGVLEWNTKVNLTAIKDEKLFIVKHFIDSLTVNEYLRNSKKIIDIGTGAGFPAIPLKIVNPDKEFTLIDSINKKLNVIRNLSEKINLENLEIIHTRAESLANIKEYREKYDIATTRAVSNLTTILEYMLPFVKVGGYSICMKGPNYKEELEQSKNAINILGGKLEEINNFNIDNEERNVIVIKKIKNTPNKYPRGMGKPLREPIR